ncbi:carbohydrate ABC transporter permease [Jiangella muralis]|uniref:carbohydrate ABC transporter permease n=1 Tax=Jiangella muralis TaxID=702383 RepID=UPI00069F940E|nr:carbohydrate ABC transporter permease [Jiangella muralis]
MTRSAGRGLTATSTYLVLGFGSILYLVPFLWMLSTSLKTQDQVYEFPIRWIPQPIDWANFVELFTVAPFLTYTVNTIIITVFGVFGSVVSSAAAAYGFARFRFRGRNALFLVMLSTMMVPIWVTIVPSYVVFSEIGWIDTYLPILVPAFFAAPFNTFLLRQFFLGIPLELDEAAKLDGAGSVRIFFTIILPLAKPALLIVGLFSFLLYWNEYMGPLIFLQSQDKFPLSLGISNFVSSQSQDFPMMMAAAMFAMIPCVLLFAVAQKQFIQGIVVTGVKG